jgi:hypothetical protein
MKFRNPRIIEHIEQQADADDRGSIWRACLAVQRSTDDKNLGNFVIELACGYCFGKNSNLEYLNTIVRDHFDDTEGEFHEAIYALKNAIELAPNKITQKIDTRKDLWLRLERLSNHQS